MRIEETDAEVEQTEAEQTAAEVAAEQTELAEELAEDVPLAFPELETLDAAGSRFRPNPSRIYVLGTPRQHRTPQVVQLQIALFTAGRAAGKTALTEAEVLAIVDAAKVAGVLVTKQPAERIFRYYRKDLREVGAIAW